MIGVSGREAAATIRFAESAGNSDVHLVEKIAVAPRQSSC